MRFTVFRPAVLGLQIVVRAIPHTRPRLTYAFVNYRATFATSLVLKGKSMEASDLAPGDVNIAQANTAPAVPGAKKIVLCFDGTGDQFDNDVSTTRIRL